MTQPPTSATSRPPVIVVGAGPVGLTVTLDLVFRGVRDVILLDEGDGPAVGSRAICWSRRSLEILSRLGIGRPLSSGALRGRPGGCSQAPRSCSASICT